MSLFAASRFAVLRRWRVALALVAGLALAGCASYGGSPYGSYPGNGGYYPGGGYGNQYGSQRFIATVVGVDARYGRLVLDAGDRRDYRQQRIEVFFDNNTRLYYQRQLYPVTGLERGDVVQVEVVESRGRLWATRIEVVRNVREYGGYRY